MDDAKLAASLEALERSGIWPCRTYRHHRGGEYEVVGTAIDEATLEPVIVYRCKRTGISWVRTLADFVATADGTARFQLAEKP